MNGGTLGKSQMAIMSVTAGVCVANIYYNQPILKEIAQTFGTNEAKAGVTSVLSQAGYGLGLLLLTPLGDKVDRKRLILLLQGLLVASLLAMAFAPSLSAVFLLSTLIGIFAVAAQVILPMAASLAGDNKGKTVGIIFTGILSGILLARVFSGLIAGWLGWRYVYGISAGMVSLTASICYMTLPNVKPLFRGSYAALLGSTLKQVLHFPILRRTSLIGALVFGAFCSFWTTLTFHLGGAPFGYSSDVIGLFGILAVGGALSAPLFGKLADKGSPRTSQIFAISLLVVAVLMIKFFPYSVMSLIIAVLLLDIGVQATQVTNVATIYTLDEEAHSRINTVYMTSYFIGGSVGTLAGVQSWGMGGWSLLTWQLLLWSVGALVITMSGSGKRPVRSAS